MKLLWGERHIQCGVWSLEFEVDISGERNARPHDSPPLVGAGLGAGSMPVVRAKCCVAELAELIPYEVCTATVRSVFL